MVTVYEGNIEEDSVRYEHHSLVLFYLEQSERYAKSALENHEEGRLQSDSISAIIFAGMTIEAFINEVAENLFPKEQLNDFSFLRGEYKKKGRSSSITKKLVILFQNKFKINLPSHLSASVEELIELRNNLVHYKLSDTATKIIYPPMKQTELSNGETMITLDFMQKPKTIIPPFVQRVTGNAAKKSFDTAINVIEFWNTQIKQS